MPNCWGIYVYVHYCPSVLCYETTHAHTSINNHECRGRQLEHVQFHMRNVTVALLFTHTYTHTRKLEPTRGSGGRPPFHSQTINRAISPGAAADSPPSTHHHEMELKNERLQSHHTHKHHPFWCHTTHTSDKNKHLYSVIQPNKMVLDWLKKFLDVLQKQKNHSAEIKFSIQNFTAALALKLNTAYTEQQISEGYIQYCSKG